MSSQISSPTVRESVPVDIPDERMYESKENAELDRDLVDAIESAQAAENEYLAELLANELGSHYFNCR